jgi:hypothetical protein
LSFKAGLVWAFALPDYHLFGVKEASLKLVVDAGEGAGGADYPPPGNRGRAFSERPADGASPRPVAEGDIGDIGIGCGLTGGIALTAVYIAVVGRIGGLRAAGAGIRR